MNAKQRRSLHVSDSITGGGAEIVFQATLQAAAELGDTTETYVGSRSRNPLSYVFSFRHYWGMRAKLRKFRPDIVHVHNFYHFLSPSILAALKSHKRANPHCRVVFTAHDYHLICPNSGFQFYADGEMRNFDPEHPRFRLGDRFDERSFAHSTLKLLQHIVAYRVLRLHRAVDVILSPSRFLKRVFENAGVAVPIVVVRNPVSLVENDSNVSARVGLVYLGRVAPEKGLVEFVRALEAAAYSTTLDVYGDGPDMQRLQRESDLAEHVTVRLKGAVPHSEVSKILTRYKAFVHASTWFENAPVSVIEAAAAGLELVVRRGGGGEEMAAFAERFHTFDDTPSSVALAIEAAYKGDCNNRLRNPEEFSLAVYIKSLGAVYGAA